MEALLQQIDSKQEQIKANKEQNEKLEKEIDKLKDKLQKVCTHPSYTPVFKQRITQSSREEAKICTICGYVCYLGIVHYDLSPRRLTKRK